MNYKAVLFDLDGTLLDATEDVGNAMNRVLDEYGFPTHTIEEYVPFFGSGARVLVTRALPEHCRDEVTISDTLEVFLEYYKRSCTMRSRIYPEASELLDELAARNIPMGILTNKPHDITLICMRDLFSAWSFKVVLGHRSGYPRKPDPTVALEAAEKMGVAPEQILFLGDTEIDMETALGAGMTPIGVAWGFREIDKLLEGGARAVIREPQSLLKFLEPSIGLG